MKDPLFGRSVNRRENRREAFRLGFLSENSDQISCLALDGFINPLSLFVDAQLLDCGFNYWHSCDFTILVNSQTTNYKSQDSMKIGACLVLVICSLEFLSLVVGIRSQYNKSSQDK